MRLGKRVVSLAFCGGFAALVGLFAADHAWADTTTEVVTPAIQGDVLLSISRMDDDSATKQLTLEDLQGFTAETFETTTIWTTGPQSFTGVPLKELLTHFDVTDGSAGFTIEARAVNDYMVEIPMTDATAGGPIVAYLRNGKTMSLRGKGPLWVVYPYDSNAAFRTEAVYSRSIWQLDSLTLKPISE